MAEEHKLTAKEEKFCQEFIKDFNATQAAIRAKYSKATARQIGSQNLSKLDIKIRIAELIEADEMHEGEIKKRISAIARTDMSDYMVKKTIPYTPRVKTPLQEVIDNRKEYLIREELFCERMGYTEEVFDKFQEGLNDVRSQIIRMEIELERDPYAYRITEGETIMIEVAELDMVKMIDDKKRGVIKSIKHTKDGIQAEGYAADAALNTLAKFKGMIVDKVQSEVVNIPLMNIDPLSEVEDVTANDSTS